MLIQLTTAVGLLAVAGLIVDFIMLNLCATRALYRQYKERLTGDLNELPAVSWLRGFNSFAAVVHPSSYVGPIVEGTAKAV